MKFLNYLAIAAIALCTVSCDDDDDPVKEEVVAPAEEVKGSYEGSLGMAVMGQSQKPSECTIQVKAEKNGTLTVVVPGFKAMGSMNMPSLNLDNVKIEKAADGKYSFTKEKFTFVDSDSKKNYVNTKGMKGSVKDGVLEMSYDIQPGEMPMPIDFTFKGNIKK